jgi:hypothetical protein
VVIKCNCDGYLGNSTASNWQNVQYGQNLRAHNPTRKEPIGSHWRCTICGLEHSKGLSEESNSKSKSKGGK